MSAGQFWACFPQRSVQGSHQPLLQYPDTAETSLKEIPPPLQQTIVIHLERDLLEERGERIAKRLTIICVFDVVASKVEFRAASGHLPIQIAEGEHIVGTDQNV